MIESLLVKSGVVSLYCLEINCNMCLYRYMIYVTWHYWIDIDIFMGKNINYMDIYIYIYI